MCPIPTSGSATITSDCILYSQIVVTGKLNVTGIPDAQGNLPKIIGGGSNRLFLVESGGDLVLNSLNLTGGYGQNAGHGFGATVYLYASNAKALIKSSYIGGNKYCKKGAIGASKGHLSIISCTFDGTDEGASIFHSLGNAGVLKVIDSKFHRQRNGKKHIWTYYNVGTVYLINNNFDPEATFSFEQHSQTGFSSNWPVLKNCDSAPTQCEDNGYTPYYGCIDKPNPNEGVECKPKCPIPTSGNVAITSDCILYSQIVITGELNVTGIPDAQGNLPKNHRRRVEPIVQS